jgi:MFS family permease
LLALVYLFQWYALFCYWQNSSKAVAQNVYEWKIPNHTPIEDSLNKQYSAFKKDLKVYVEDNKLNAKEIFAETVSAANLYASWKDKIQHPKFGDNDIVTIDAIDVNEKKYEKAVSQTGGINGWYNIVTFLIAFALVGFAKRYSPKYVHFVCLLLAGFGFIAFSQFHQISLLYVAITGFGVGWASMMGIPYLMVVAHIPKEKYGVYMGIINMMIVIPMLIQTMTFGYILKHFFNNDPTKAILFAGVLLLIAAAATLLIKNKKVNSEMMNAPITGGH